MDKIVTTTIHCLWLRRTDAKNLVLINGVLYPNSVIVHSTDVDAAKPVA
ncbi:hypothetical protein [Schlesneria paludicola]|nr:hypothetical protein [Schlesneria paludicola]